MELHELSFAKIIILREDIAEVIVNDGVEMNVEMVDEYHDFLLTHMQAPFSLLVNKINAYTYDFEAQKKLCVLEEINVMAAVVYKLVTEISTETMVAFPREIKWNLKIFSNRDEAYAWLVYEQHQLMLRAESTQGKIGLV